MNNDEEPIEMKKTFRGALQRGKRDAEIGMGIWLVGWRMWIADILRGGAGYGLCIILLLPPLYLVALPSWLQIDISILLSLMVAAIMRQLCPLFIVGIVMIMHIGDWLRGETGKEGRTDNPPCE